MKDGTIDKEEYRIYKNRKVKDSRRNKLEWRLVLISAIMS